MPTVKEYNRNAAVSYAQKWALARNPNYYDFHEIGGDCTNFISQCLYAGSNVMNYTKTFGWYYISATNRAPAWTGVNQLYKFLIRNNTKAVFAEEAELSELMIGDIIQLAKYETGFYHSLMITQTGDNPTINNTYISTHTLDSLNRPLNTYNFDTFRCLHILGVYI